MGNISVCRACGAMKLAINTRIALTGHQSVVITGCNRADFISNTGIGKTTAVNQRVIPMLEANKLDVSYFDIGRNLRRRFPSRTELYDAQEMELGALRALLRKPFDVMIIDDVHHALFCDSRESVLCSLCLNIWNDINESASNGRQFVFITGYHPLGFSRTGALARMPGAGMFLNSPVIEYKIA